MRMERRFKPETVASQDDSRLAIQNLSIDIHNDKTVVVATDGRRLVVVPCEIDSIHEIGLVPVEAIKQARTVKVKRQPRQSSQRGRYRNHDIEPAELEVPLNGQAKFDKGPVHITIDRPDEYTVYPKWQPLIPLSEPTFTVGLNAELLAGLAEALGSDGMVTLQFRGADKIIHVTADKHSGAFGLLMPCRIG